MLYNRILFQWNLACLEAGVRTDWSAIVPNSPSISKVMID